MAEPSGGTRTESGRARCVVYHAGEVHPKLGEALRRRGLTWSEWTSGALALADVVRDNGGTRAVLLVVEPRRVKELGAVIGVVERYRPETPIWKFDGSALSRSSAAELRNTGAAGGAKDVPTKPEVVVRSGLADVIRGRGESSAPSGPKLRLSGFTGQAFSDPVVANRDPESASGPDLTAEELRMLMGDPENEHGRTDT